MPETFLPEQAGLEAGAWLAAIIECSDDAIISKTLDGIITSWNGAAERMFGIAAAEAVGQSITLIIPSDRLPEEAEILAKIRDGQRVDHFETVRRGRDGTLIDVSVTISPVRDAQGKIQGASKILRDVTPRKRARERQDLLLREMDHRVKNLFAVTAGMIALSARNAESVADLATSLGGRVAALARAHALTLSGSDGLRHGEAPTRLTALLRAVLEPFAEQCDIQLVGRDVPVASGHLTSLAMMLHEFATNAAKHGALSAQAGRLTVQVSTLPGALQMVWTEVGGPKPEPAQAGFGTRLEKATLATLGGTIDREWRSDGVVIVLNVPLERLA